MSPRAKLALVALLFAAPLALASLAYVLDWIPGGHGNYGSLVTPARPLPALALADAGGTPPTLAGKWSLIYLAGAACDEACAERLALTRQVWLALAKHRLRVQRVYLAPDAAALAQAQQQLGPVHPDLLLVAERGVPGARAADFFRPREPHALYLADPLGNFVMRYEGPLEHKGVHRDLRKLLRFSQVG